MWPIHIASLLACYLASSAAEDFPVAHLVLPQGYPFEEHEVVTEDGYILALHRIPFGKKNRGRRGRPVIMQHGIIGSSAFWLLSSPDRSLGFIMADQGYDVWMPNNRGNTYSMKHKTLDPKKCSDKKKFWNFSFHEMGYYDMPATIDYILNKTQEKDLYYIGHSQGTTQFFVMMSTRPEYNQKVVHMSALAPIAFLDHTRGTLKSLLYYSSSLIKIANYFGIHKILTRSSLLRGLERTLCKATSCGNFFFTIAGYDANEMDMTLLSITTNYIPAGASIKQLVHFSQLANNGKKFRQFDYGEKENIDRYNQSTPPDYDLSKITAPVMLHYSLNDWVSGILDVIKLKYKLPNSGSRLVPLLNFNHLDFMWAKDAWQLLYKDMIDIIKRY